VRNCGFFDRRTFNGRSGVNQEDDAMDILKETINIGIGEAAASLSELVNSRVAIRVPDVRILDTADIPEFVGAHTSSLGVYMSQAFHGLLEGKAILFYTESCSVALLRALFGGDTTVAAITESGRATLQEVGNIILVSCISKIGDMVGIQTVFDLPSVTVETSETYFRNMVQDLKGLDKAIVVQNEISILQEDVVGYLFILMGLRGFELIQERMNLLAGCY
jgi:chemotaxis protein CheC